MNGKLEQFANSKFMQWLRDFSQKLSASPLFSTISSGMGATMGLIMIGAVIQIVCAVLSMATGWSTGNAIYDMIYMPYKLTMGMLGLFMCFTLAYTYSKKLKMNGQIQHGFTAMVCFILVASPVVSATNASGSTFDALNLGSLGATGMFSAMIIGLLSVRISKFAVDHKWVIKMPDVVPEGVVNSFNSIIPLGLNILFWYGLSIAIASISGGMLTLSTLIMYVLSIPISYLVSPVGMIVIIILGQFFWFFGIHGSGVIFTAIMPVYVAAYMTNAELAAQGLPLVFSAIFLYGANGGVGGTGNTLPLCLMGWNSKSEQIKAVSRASLVPGLFNINEPVIFGFPIMYNPILLIPFILCPIVVLFFLWGGYAFGLLSYPKVLLLTILPIGLPNFLQTFDWRNFLFPFLMIPVCWAVYYPFFKIYEKQCIEREQAALAAETVVNEQK